MPPESRPETRPETAALRPMLATATPRVPAGAEWVHEVKWDGMRVLAAAEAGALRLSSRTGNDVSAAFPELAALGASLGAVPGGGDDGATVLDGEVVALAEGRPSFAALADRIHLRGTRAVSAGRRAPVTLLVFDVLRLAGRDLTGLPWHERRGLLEQAVVADERWQVPPAYDDGAMLLQATREQGLEGVVSKLRESPYRPGVRSRDWLKLPHRARASFVVGGWRPEEGSTSRLGALLLGTPTPRGLVFRGRVGSGLAGRSARALHELLEPLAADASPFVGELPRADRVGTWWVRPQLVVDVESLGSAALVAGGAQTGARLRQPAYRGVRADLDPDDLLDSADPIQE